MAGSRLLLKLFEFALLRRAWPLVSRIRTVALIAAVRESAQTPAEARTSLATLTYRPPKSLRLNSSASFSSSSAFSRASSAAAAAASFGSMVGTRASAAACRCAWIAAYRAASRWRSFACCFSFLSIRFGRRRTLLSDVRKFSMSWCVITDGKNLHADRERKVGSPPRFDASAPPRAGARGREAHAPLAEHRADEDDDVADDEPAVRRAQDERDATARRPRGGSGRAGPRTHLR